MRKNRRKRIDDPFPENWPRWVKVRLKEFDATEQDFFNDFEATINLDHAPKWVMKMFVELYKLAAPAIPLPVSGADIPGPYFLGSFCGQIEALINSKYGLNLVLQKFADASKELDVRIKATLTKQQFAYWLRERQKADAVIRTWEERVEEIWKKLEVVVAKKKLVVQRCIETAAKQKNSDQKIEFFDAFQRAAKTRIFDEDGHFYHAKPTHEKVTSSTICFLMVYHWRVVEKFHNFGEYRRWLAKRFGSKSIGSTDRLRKLCRRYGYNPGGEPGRPSGSTKRNADEFPDSVKMYLLTSDVFKPRRRARK